MEVMYDGRDSSSEEEAEDGGDDDDEQDDGKRARRMERADAPGGDTFDRRREDYGEKSGNVDDQEFTEEGPGNQKQNRDAEAEENVAADGAAGGCLGGGGFGGGGFGGIDQRGAPSRVLSGLDAASVLRGGRARKCGV